MYYSENFEVIFIFFLLSYRYKILDFSGVDVKTKMDISKENSKLCFKIFENGDYSKEEIYSTGIPTRHPNILKGIIIGKKSWGLHVKMWSEGISEGLFTIHEILKQFEEVNIKIPEPFILDLKNNIRKKLFNLIRKRGISSKYELNIGNVGGGKKYTIITFIKDFLKNFIYKKRNLLKKKLKNIINIKNMMI
jgi:hypothetical protein